MFSVDLTGLISNAATFFNQLFPVYVPVLAIILGVGLVGMLIAVIKGLFHGIG